MRDIGEAMNAAFVADKERDLFRWFMVIPMNYPGLRVLILMGRKDLDPPPTRKHIGPPTWRKGRENGNTR